MKMMSASVMVGVVVSGAVQAQDIALGVGQTDFTSIGSDGAAFALDYRARPFAQRRVASWAFAATAAVTEFGDVFVGAGISTRWAWPSGWFIESNFTPGVYAEGTPENDLGSAFNFRSLLGAGYRFDNGAAISVAITHISNAGLFEDNPGTNKALVRYHIPF